MGSACLSDALKSYKGGSFTLFRLVRAIVR